MVAGAAPDGSTSRPAVKLVKTPSSSGGVCMGSGGAFILGIPGGAFDLRVMTREDGCFYCNPGAYTTIAPGYPAVHVDHTLLAGSFKWVPEVIEVWMCV